jgi:nicotinamidase-related amidase/mannose-6-phosphate isomerase-like protein (cupin superfamily)
VARIGSPRNAWHVHDDQVNLVRRRPDPRPLLVDGKPQPFVLDLARTACVVVDMQNDFCSPGGWLHSIGVDVTPARRPIEPLRQFLPLLRGQEVPIIWCNWGNRPDRANLPPGVLHVYNPDGTSVGIGDALPAHGGRVLQAGSWSAAVVDELAVVEGDITVDKYRMSGFCDTALDSILRNLDVTTVLFCGVNVDQCVFATLADAAGLGYDVVLLDDCSATTSPELCTQAVRYNVAQCFGFVTDASDIAAALAGEPERDTAPTLFDARHVQPYRISPGDSVRLAVLHHPTSRHDVTVVLEVWDVGGAQPPNSHPRSVETFFFLAGTGTAYCDRHVSTVAAGQLLVLPPRSTHRIVNDGPTRLSAITTMAPDDGPAPDAAPVPVRWHP